MNKLLTPLQGFYAMQLFLEDYFRATSSDSLGALLSCMCFLDDGDTADPVLWIDWRAIVADSPVTPMQAFQAMKVFLDIYFQSTSSSNVKNLFHDIELVLEEQPGKEQIWQKWMASTNLVLEHE